MATDAEIRAAGLYAVPKNKYLQNEFQLPTNEVVEEETESFGIPNTNAFTNSGGATFNSAGNAFGYGSQIEPGGSYGSYDSINYTGGLPGNVQQYGIGRQFEDPSASPTGETYSYKKEVPGFMRIAGGFIPGGNFLLNLAEKRMNANRDQPPGNYRIGGLDESMKGYYDNLAGSGMLFDGPGGVKTLTGKNFAGKGYLEGQMELAKGFGFDEMSEEEIQSAINAMKQNPRKQFKYKQMLEASQMYKTNKAQEKNIENMANLKAAESRRESARQYDPAVHGKNNYGLGADGKQSYDSGQGFGTNATSGGPVSNKTGKGRTDYMEGGRAGYFFGGRVNYKAGGRIGFRGGGMDMGNEENQAQSAAMGNTTVSNNNDGGNDNPPNFFVKDKTSIIDTSGLKSKSPEINIDYTDPRNYASLKSKIYNKNILDNDDINVDGTLSGKIGPVSYNTNFTDQGITGTNLKAGNFNAGIDANKNYRLGYANNYNNINYGTTYDSNGNLMFTAGVNFKNGGLAGLL